jgi:hypothetical protein
MIIFQNTVLSTRYYGVEFDSEDAFEDWFNWLFDRVHSTQIWINSLSKWNSIKELWLLFAIPILFNLLRLSNRQQNTKRLNK